MASNSMSTAFRTSNTVITAFGILNQFHGSITSSYVVRKDSTINYKRNCFPSLGPTKVPTAKYFGIGINGFENIVDTNMSEPFLPDPQNLDLYEPIPFRMIPLEDDAAFAAEREANGYRLRCIEEVNGVQYACYYLKLIEFEQSSPSLTMVDANDHETPFEIDVVNKLNPAPSRPTTTSIINATTNRIVASLPGICSIYGSEVVEVMNIKYGAEGMRRAKISELGIYTGEDVRIIPEQHGGDLEYTEAIYTQLSAHRCWIGTFAGDPSVKLRERYVFENGSMILV
nr:MAG TPA: hypothetical protein [Caudoviricetes sp.]